MGEEAVELFCLVLDGVMARHHRMLLVRTSSDRSRIYERPGTERVRGVIFDPNHVRCMRTVRQVIEYAHARATAAMNAEQAIEQKADEATGALMARLMKRGST